MRIHTKKIFFIKSFLLIILLYVPALSVQKDSEEVFTDRDTVVINEVSGPPDTSADAFVKYIDYNTINNRAKSMKCTAIADSSPFADNSAFFLLHPRIEIPVTGMVKAKKYSIFIDFVRYKSKKIQFSGILKIFIKDIYGNEQMIGTVDSSFLYSEKIFSREIPFNLSYTGSFTIIIQEYSMTTGNWGIWDIIITSKSLDEIEQVRSEALPGIKDSGIKIFN